MPQKEWEPKWSEQAGCWTVDFSVQGRRIRKRLGIRDRGERSLARQAAKNLWQECWQDHLNPEPEITGTPFFKAAKGYVDDGGEARFLPPLMQYFGRSTVIEDIGPNEMAEAASQIYPGRARSTIRRQVIGPISAVKRWAAGERREPAGDIARTRWLTPEEAERLLTAAAHLTLPRHSDPETETLAKIAFLLGTGTRTGECFAADVDDWNKATNQVWISGEETGAGKTAKASRWVQMPVRTLTLIGDRPIKGRLFRTPYGKPIVLRKNGGGQMATAFNNARAMAGLGDDVTPHVLRHTWATWFYAQTKDFGGLMDLGGWAKADMANRYRKLAPADLSERLLAHGWEFRQEFGKPDLRTIAVG